MVSRILLLVCSIMLIAPSSASANTAESLDVTKFPWKSSAVSIKKAMGSSAQVHRHRRYARLSRKVTLQDQRWTHYVVFHKDRPIAQGYTRSEKLKKSRVGTISDAVSYDNEYWVADRLRAAFGDPDFIDLRTKSEFSEEMGDDALRMERAVEWDMLGERLRWELDDGTVRYSVKYSVDGRRLHNVVNVNPASWSHYFNYQTAAAFRRAGVRRWKNFQRQAQRWTTKRATADGSIETYLSADQELTPREPKRSQYTTPVRFEDRRGEATLSYYGGILYRVDVDFSETRPLPRRGHFDKIGMRYYRFFKALDKQLRRAFGSPDGSKDAGDDLDNNRVQYRISRLIHSLEGYWSTWLDVGNDILVRQAITGKQVGTDYHIDHRVQFYFHEVARVIAERRAWEAETQLIQEK